MKQFFGLFVTMLVAGICITTYVVFHVGHESNGIAIFGALLTAIGADGARRGWQG